MSNKKTVTLPYEQHEAMEKEINELKEKISKQERDIPVLKYEREQWGSLVGCYYETVTFTLSQTEEAKHKLNAYFKQESDKLSEIELKKESYQKDIENLLSTKQTLQTELEDGKDQLKDLELKISDKKVSSFIIKGFCLVVYSVLLLSI